MLQLVSILINMYLLHTFIYPYTHTFIHTTYKRKKIHKLIRIPIYIEANIHSFIHIYISSVYLNKYTSIHVYIYVIYIHISCETCTGQIPNSSDNFRHFVSHRSVISLFFHPLIYFVTGTQSF